MRTGSACTMPTLPARLPAQAGESVLSTSSQVPPSGRGTRFSVQGWAEKFSTTTTGSSASSRRTKAIVLCAASSQIGRASCRERVEMAVGAGSLKKKTGEGDGEGEEEEEREMKTEQKKECTQ